MKNPKIRRVDYDIVVVGGGGAGAEAAISITDKYTDLSVALVEKGIFGKSGCTMLGGYSCNAALGYEDPRDNPDSHFEDTVREGRYINDQKLVEIYANEAPERVKTLQKFGPTFEERADGKMKQGMVPGHTYPRAVFQNLHTGKTMITTLHREVLRRNVDVFNECIVLEIVVSENKVQGAIGYDIKNGDPIIFRCKSLVITTGGCGQLYEKNTTSVDNTGDGLALAYNAGAELKDMEFVQFYPTAQCYPKLLGMNPTAPAALRFMNGARIYNKDGVEFLNEKIPDWRFKATRDQISQAIAIEVKEGRGSPHGGVYMDVLHLPPEKIEEAYSFSNMFENFLKIGIDLRKDAFEVTVPAHFFMGGIKVDENFSTCVEGLSAGGEAIAGIHGANRLCGNALSEILVSGYNAGTSASKYSGKAGQPKVNFDIEVWLNKISTWLERDSGISPVNIKRRIQKLMWDKVGVVRNSTELEEAIEQLEAIKGDLSRMYIETKTLCWNSEIVDAIEVSAMVEVALLISKAALYRKESRGAHYREDFPHIDNKNWLLSVVFQKDRPIKTAKPSVTKIALEEME